MNKNKINVTISPWNNNYKLVKLESEKLEVLLLSLGATIHSVTYKDSKTDVILGFDEVSGYDQTDNPFFWGTTGRFTNRVKNGKFKIDGQEYQLPKNDFGNENRNHLHGGHRSYDRLNWNTEILDSGDGVVFSILDPHDAEGYPGNMVSSVSYRLTNDNHLDIKMMGVCDRSTIINMSNHVYFNLAGHYSGWEGLKKHKLKINAETFTPDDEEYLPTGEIIPVTGTENDFQSGKMLTECVDKARGGVGYCVNFCVANKENSFHQVASLEDPTSMRKLEVHSDQPGLELYTANFLPDTHQDALKGKNGSNYRKWGGICLMTQNYRDAANHQNFPDCVLKPGQIYSHNVSYRFY